MTVLKRLNAIFRKDGLKDFPFLRLSFMSIRKKITFNFLLSVSIIIALAVFEYLNFLEIRNEIKNLEVVDTLRSKSLQLRRHEENFFLLSPSESGHELNEIHRYMDEITSIISTAQKQSHPAFFKYIFSKGKIMADQEALSRLRTSVDKYNELFQVIEKTSNEVLGQLYNLRRHPDYERISLLVEATFLEQPSVVAEFLRQKHIISADHRIFLMMKDLHSNIQMLRKYGDDIISISKKLDGLARQRAEKIILVSKIAILVFLPLFIITGLGLLFIVSGSVVNRLKLLIDFVEKTGRGNYSPIPVMTPEGSIDEVSILIQKFNEMENQLAKREDELERKNRELIQSRKLAALGSLAAGVAHELNNPLNNIYISAQVLKREARNLPNPSIQEVIDDIMNQSLRVKHIVADLLEFARGREPVFRETDLREVVLGSYKFVSTTRNTKEINFSLEPDIPSLMIKADPEQLERVFINLFNNAIDSMKGRGDLKVSAMKAGEALLIKVSDTGEGIPPELRDKIFEPFYSTKERGTGLGLAIVYNIIKKHGGDITVESEVGKGTTFTIKL
uniref:histidine kinase n=1 Tax=Thermodesulfovibrio aggregans TaxID=86166 RepID=A0A7C4EM55_9BACT